MAPRIDSAILKALALDAEHASISTYGGSGFSSTFRIQAKDSTGKKKLYFVKTRKGMDGKIMFIGEHMSLNAIHAAVHSLGPRSHAYGEMSDTSDSYFLVTDFLDLSARPSSGNGSGISLAQKLVKLHSTPAPTPEGFGKPAFGFPVPTCCGNTVQPNTYSTSWAEFYGSHRLRAILESAEKRNGKDSKLSTHVESTILEVVPALLADGHLTTSAGGPIMPVIIHGDLWSGNHGKGSIDGGDIEEVVFDPSSSYSHSEFDFGIMRMFGGFGKGFEEEYYRFKEGGKDEPVDEWEDRIKLYELYHQLNHYSMFGGGYKNAAIAIMKDLIGKYARG